MVLLPVRCFTCGKILGHYFHIAEFNDTIFSNYNINNHCCRNILMTSVDIHENLRQPINSSIIKVKNKLETKKITLSR